MQCSSPTLLSCSVPACRPSNAGTSSILVCSSMSPVIYKKDSIVSFYPFCAAAIHVLAIVTMALVAPALASRICFIHSLRARISKVCCTAYALSCLGCWAYSDHYSEMCRHHLVEWTEGIEGQRSSDQVILGRGKALLLCMRKIRGPRFCEMSALHGCRRPGL